MISGRIAGVSNAHISHELRDVIRGWADLYPIAVYYAGGGDFFLKLRELSDLVGDDWPDELHALIEHIEEVHFVDWLLIAVVDEETYRWIDLEILQ